MRNKIANKKYQVFDSYSHGCLFPKKNCLGPQNSSESSGTKELPKIVNFATIKETEKIKETMAGSKWNRLVATKIHLDHSSSLKN